MTKLITPPFLKPNDTIGIVAMASQLDVESIKPIIEELKSKWDLKVILGKSIFEKEGIFAGSVDLRTQDMQTMLDNEDIKAIFSARGGYGSYHIIDALNFKKFKKNPKWIIGFSDITMVLNQLQNLGYECIHGPMPKTFHYDEYSTESLRKILFGEKIAYTAPSHLFNREGSAKGIITGGNLCLLVNSLGTKSELNTNRKILFIEDIDEKLPNIDRMMVQLKRAKKLDSLAGLIVGSFSGNIDSDPPFGKTPYEIISQHIEKYDFPVCFDFPIGHEKQNYPIICGRNVDLEVHSKGVKLTFESF